MEITAVNSGIGLRTQVSFPNAERAASRIMAKKDANGDNRLSASELGENSKLIQKADTNSDLFVDQQELLAALQRRIQERTDIKIEVTLNINVLKANLGNLLSSILGNDSGSNLLGNIFTGGTLADQNSQANINIRERFILATAFNSLEGRGITGSSNTSSGIFDTSTGISSLFNSGNDNQQLLLSLLTDGLNTPKEEANEIINILQSQTFSVVA